MKKKILIDYHSWAQTRIPYKFLVNALSIEGPIEVVAYNSVRLRSFFESSRAGARFRFGIPNDETRKFYRTKLGAGRLVSTSLPFPKFKKWNLLYESIVQDIQNLHDLEEMCVEGILVGDLIYDAFCKHYSVASPSIEDHRLHGFIREAVFMLGHWVEFFARNSVSAVIGDSVYLQGLPLRVAISSGVRAYIGNLSGLEQLDSANPYEDSLFRHYPELAQLIQPEKLNSGIGQAEKNLKALLSGQPIKRKNLYDGPSAFAQRGSVGIKLRNDKSSVVIVPHDFFDSSHMRGPHLHPDFRVWLWEVGRLSREIDVNWFLKPHPRESQRTLEVLRKFGQEFDHIRFLPGDVNPASLLELNVTTALTVKGTIAGEYPLLGIRVICASVANFHVRYPFSLSPDNLESYESMLRELVRNNETPTTEGIYEFFYLRHIFEYEGSFLNPEEIQSIDWFSSLNSSELWRHYNQDREDKMQHLVDGFVSRNAHWLRGDLLFRLESGSLEKIDLSLRD